MIDPANILGQTPQDQGASLRDRAAGPSDPSPQAVSAKGSIPSAGVPAYPWSTIRAKCLHLAAQQERHHRAKAYARDLRHIAADCQAAADGCPASAESVLNWLRSDGLLSAELAWDAWADDPLPTASGSTVPAISARAA